MAKKPPPEQSISEAQKELKDLQVAKVIDHTNIHDEKIKQLKQRIDAFNGRA